MSGCILRCRALTRAMPASSLPTSHRGRGFAFRVFGFWDITCSPVLFPPFLPASSSHLRHLHPSFRPLNWSWADFESLSIPTNSPCTSRHVFRGGYPEWKLKGMTAIRPASCSATRQCVCVFITGEGESQNKGKQIWSYEERR